MRPSFPLAVDLELTDACNLACRHCMAADGQPVSTLPTETALNLLDEFAGVGVHALSLTGGEPTLHPDFVSVLRRGAELGFHLQVSTNAVALDPVAVAELATTRAFVNVSLDGADAATHDELRGLAGAFSATCEGIKTLTQAGARVRVETVLMQANANQIPHLARIAARLGASRYVVNDLRVTGRAASGSENGLRASDATLFRVAAELPAIGRAAGIAVEPVRWTGEHPGADRRGDCSAAVVKCGVHADGTFVPCLLFPPSIGLPGLGPAWQSRLFAEVADAVTHPGAGCAVNGETPCPGCGGGCRAAAYALTGSVTGPDPSCRRDPQRSAEEVGA